MGEKHAMHVSIRHARRRVLRLSVALDIISDYCHGNHLVEEIGISIGGIRIIDHGHSIL